MTGYRGTDDAGTVADPLTPESLRPLLHGARASVLVEPVPDPAAPRAGASARARRSGPQGWQVTVQSGGGEPARSAEAPNTDAVFDLLRSWAADDGWWAEAFTWQPVSG